VLEGLRFRPLGPALCEAALRDTPVERRYDAAAGFGAGRVAALGIPPLVA
jgi:hypothetical protein